MVGTSNLGAWNGHWIKYKTIPPQNTASVHSLLHIYEFFTQKKRFNLTCWEGQADFRTVIFPLVGLASIVFVFTL